MFGSMFYLFSQQNPQSDPNNQPPIDPSSENVTSVSYGASDIPAKVLQIFPTAIVVGKTKEAETSTLDSKIMATGKVAGVLNSQFLQNSDYYRAEIKAASPDNFVQIQIALDGIDSFSEVSVYPEALVLVPPKIELKNSDSGLLQEQTFQNNQIVAALSTETLKGDDISIDLVATFQGQKLTYAFGQEKDNLNNKQQLFFVNNVYKVSGLSQDFAFNIQAGLDKKKTLEDVNSDIYSSLADFNLESKLATSTNSFTINFNKPFISQDLNALLAQIKESGKARDYTILEDQNKAVVVAADDQNLLPFREMLKNELDSLNFKYSEIEDPVYFLQGKAAGVQKDKFLKTIEGQAQKYGLNYDVLQKALFDANSVVVQGGTTYALPAGFFEAYVKPTHKANDDVNMAIVIVASKRAGVVQINGQEMEPEQK